MLKRNLCLFVVALTASACLSSGVVRADNTPICQGATRVNVILGPLHTDPRKDGVLPPDVDQSAAETGNGAPHLEWNDLNTASDSITVRCFNGSDAPPVVKVFPANALPGKCVVSSQVAICT